MDFEEFLEAVKTEAIRMEKSSCNESEAKEKIDEAWAEMEESSGDKMFADQYDDVKKAEESYSKGKMNEDVYNARIKNAVSTAAWNVWMLA